MYRALGKCTVTLLTERRRLPPRGAAGGQNGSPGRNTHVGRELPAKCRLTLDAGDTLGIDTPAGGGWGTPAQT